MQLKEVIKAYLGYGRRDHIAVTAGLVIIGVVYSLPYVFAKNENAFPAKATSVLVKAIDTLEREKSQHNTRMHEGGDNNYPNQSKQAKNIASDQLFKFDPNTLSVDGWQKLGLSERTSRTIDKYRSKGGKFHQPEDIRKIWGIPQGFYERVKDYIVISPIQNNYQENDGATVYSKFEKKVVVVNINQADTTAFIALAGIGSKLAARIVNFRDKLGGFYSVDQVGETYGLPDSTFQKLKSSFQLSGSVRKLNVNTATKDELKVHPYFKWNLANAIVEYRNQHGAFKSLDELKNIAIIDDAAFDKIVHYLTL